MSDDLKEIMRTKGDSQELPPEVAAKLQEVEEKLLGIINDLAEEYSNNIPFTVLKEKSEYDYQVISDVLLHLIMQKKLLGFINDGGTESLDDDILIIRDSRFVDTLEMDYETGYAE